MSDPLPSATLKGAVDYHKDCVFVYEAPHLVWSWINACLNL